MDDADLTERHREITEKSNYYQSIKDVPLAEATGYCLFCDEEVEENRRWCSAQCRDDWQTENKI
jgi:hypothetical protein